MPLKKPSGKKDKVKAKSKPEAAAADDSGKDKFVVLDSGFTIKKTEKTCIKGTIVEVDGVTYLNIREFYRKEGEGPKDWKPTSKGFMLAMEHADSFRRKVSKLVKENTIDS